MNLSKLDILRMLQILPKDVYYNPIDGSYFKKSKASKVVKNKDDIWTYSILHGIDPNKIISFDKCIPVHNSVI